MACAPARFDLSSAGQAAAALPPLQCAVSHASTCDTCACCMHTHKAENLPIVDPVLNQGLQRVLARKVETCCSGARASAAEARCAMPGWPLQEESCTEAQGGWAVRRSILNPEIPLLRALQDNLLATVQAVFALRGSADLGPRGVPLSSAVLQLLPLTLTVGTWPSQPRARFHHQISSLVRLTLKGRCATSYRITFLGGRRDRSHGWLCMDVQIDLGDLAEPERTRSTTRPILAACEGVGRYIIGIMREIDCDSELLSLNPASREACHSELMT